jgi:hypothetical protein
MKLARHLAATGVVVLLVLWLATAFAVDPPSKDAPAAAKPKQSPPVQKDAPKDESLSTFMRAKLSASTKVLEGLALEDLDLVTEGARELNTMSTAEKWRRHDDMLYRQFSAEFRQTTADLLEASKAGLLDRSALKWMDATMNCIECHRYVRNKLVVGSASTR